jgi:hypothetical protein
MFHFSALLLMRLLRFRQFVFISRSLFLHCCCGYWYFDGLFVNIEFRERPKSWFWTKFSFRPNIGPCHVSGIFLPLRVKSLPLATIYEVEIPLRKWKKSLLQRNPAQMTSAIISRLPKLPESTRRKQAIFNKGYLFYSHCDTTITVTIEQWAQFGQTMGTGHY